MLHRGETISACWTRLAGIRQPALTRAERYAALTLPHIMTPDGVNAASVDQSHDYQSIGAVAVNHVVNKLAVAMFSPAKPFFKLSPDKKLQAQIVANEQSEEDVSAALAFMERDACRQLDALAQRPVLYSALRQLVVVGDAVAHFGKDQIRLFTRKHFCVKRNRAGKVHTLIIRERIKFDEVEESVQALLGKRYQPDTEVSHYTLIERVLIKGKAHYTQRMAIDEIELTDKEYTGRWLERDCPWRVLAWELEDEADYARSLVEQYSGDFEALSILCEAQANGGVLAAEFRYLLNPSMQTSVEDFNQSKNGDALSGQKGDIEVITGGNPESLKVNQSIIEWYERRINRAFLLNSAVTRDAERVTAEEIRMTAMELETSFGGTYTSLAAGFQQPVAQWLLDLIDKEIKNAGFEVVIITGLDALSRNGELENLRLAFQDLAILSNVPPMLMERLKFDKIATFIGSRRGVDFKEFLKTDEEVAQTRAATAQQQAQAAGQTAAAETAGEQAGAQPQ